MGLVDAVISRGVDMHENKQACVALAENVCYAYLLYGKESQLSDSAAAAEKLWKQFSSIVSEVICLQCIQVMLHLCTVALIAQRVYTVHASSHACQC